MTPAVVVDLGNSRMKWGRLAADRIAAWQALPYDSPAAWQQLLQQWSSLAGEASNLAGPWLLAGVAPKRIDQLCDWLHQRGMTAHMLTSRTLLGSVPGFRTRVEEPERVGIDRLLNALAAHRLAALEASAPLAVAVVSVGTAVTVDCVEPDGTHVGGAIYPGPRLMAQSLHEAAALLPEVSVPRYLAARSLGRNTVEAIQLGITRAVVHAADGIIHDWAASRPFCLFLTGGDAGIFKDFLFAGSWTEVRTEPTLALEGLRLAAEALP